MKKLKTATCGKRNETGLLNSNFLQLVVAASVAAGGASWVAPARAQTVGSADTTPPSIEYGQLYADVELAKLFPDSKTFPDLVPVKSPSEVVADYNSQKSTQGFSLSAFVASHFSASPVPAGPSVQTADPGTGLLSYVHSLWPVLTQSSPTAPAYSTLLPLPYPYVVPGGRFREVYYWDSYFTSLGLEGDGEHALTVDLLKNFAYEIDRYGLVPNGSRSYYLSRSQPPFFSYLVELAASKDGARTLVTYLPEMRKEYDYWMRGERTTAPGAATRSVVRLLDGTVLNRNWDDRDVPRDESYAEDVATAGLSDRPSSVVWRNLRAAAASGWDFSSRWLADGKTLATVQTLDILPVDLNSLLVHLESTLGKAYFLAGDYKQAFEFAARADHRGKAIRRLMWDGQIGGFTDYLWAGSRTTGALTAATLYPLYAGIATQQQADVVAATLGAKLLGPGGMLTSTVQSKQQWDAPNGWAPLQWIAVQGLRAYGHETLATDIATRWVHKVIAGYQQQAKLVEKYDVLTTGGDAGGGGEYTTQIGFGWTNGVLVALTALYPELRAQAAAAVPEPSPAP